MVAERTHCLRIHNRPRLRLIATRIEIHHRLRQNYCIVAAAGMERNHRQTEKARNYRLPLHRNCKDYCDYLQKVLRAFPLVNLLTKLE